MRSGASLPSDVSGTSIVSVGQSEQSSFILLVKVSLTEARMAKAETLTYTAFAFPPLSATTLAASISPIGAFCSGDPMLNVTSVPCSASEQQVANSTPAFSAAASGPASASLSAALMMTASAPSRIAALKAPCTFSGEPSVPTCLTDQPRILRPLAGSAPAPRTPRRRS